MRVRVLACAGLFLWTTSCLFGQETRAAHPARSADSSSVAQRDYRFEVASVRPTGPPQGFAPGHGPGPAYTPGHYRERNISLTGLAFEAFKINHGYQMEWPSWMGSTYFAVEATLPDGAGKADLPIMLQHLLEDRFAFKYHHEARHTAGYELVVAKSGAKMAKGTPPDPNQPKGSAYEFGKGSMQFAKGARSGFFVGPAGAVCCTAHWLETNLTMNQLASSLADKVQAPVMDATGLDGTYGFTLVYTPEPFAGGGAAIIAGPPVAAAPTAGAAGASAPMEHPLMRDALQEQLGLKLQPVKSVPIDVVVVEGASREPTEN
jgi:uncharacterized protein (TIGR03435 family)